MAHTTRKHPSTHPPCYKATNAHVASSKFQTLQKPNLLENSSDRRYGQSHGESDGHYPSDHHHHRHLRSSVAGVTPATKYINHTVGRPTGWFFNSTSNTSFTNYSSWAASQTFNLGDYLIFNTENQTVIETQNITTYRSCSADDASDESTFVWGDDSVGVKKIIAVPLVIEGTDYYFSGAGDGQQCQQGMAFAIEVNHGLGLPPILAQPPPPPYMEPPSQSPPGTVDGTQPSGNGGFRSGASLAGGLFAFFALLILTV